MDSLLHLSSLRSSKCKKHLQLTIERIKILRNKKTIIIKQERTDIAKLFQNGNTGSARTRVEHAIKEQNIVDAYNILEQCCNNIIDDMRIIDSKKECSPALRASIATLMYATPRCGELQELQSIREFITSKYGAEFVANAIQLHIGCAVDNQVVRCLSSHTPNTQTKLELLKDIAREYNISWDYEKSLNKSLQKRADSQAEPEHSSSNAGQSDSTPDSNPSTVNCASSEAPPLKELLYEMHGVELPAKSLSIPISQAVPLSINDQSLSTNKGTATCGQSSPFIGQQNVEVSCRYFEVEEDVQVAGRGIGESATQEPIKYAISERVQVVNRDPVDSPTQMPNAKGHIFDEFQIGHGSSYEVDKPFKNNKTDKISASVHLDGRVTDLGVEYKQHNKAWMFANERETGVNVRYGLHDSNRRKSYVNDCGDSVKHAYVPDLQSKEDQWEEGCNVHSGSDESVESLDSSTHANSPNRFTSLVSSQIHRLSGSGRLLNKGLGSRGDISQRLKHRMEERFWKEDVELSEADDEDAEPVDISDQMQEVPFEMNHLTGLVGNIESNIHGALLNANRLRLSQQPFFEKSGSKLMWGGPGKLKWYATTPKYDAELHKDAFTKNYVTNTLEQGPIPRPGIRLPDAEARQSLKGKSFYGESRRTRPTRR